MKNKTIVYLLLVAFTGGLFLQDFAYSQDSPSTVPPASERPSISVTDAFFKTYGKPWAAGTDEERAKFLERFGSSAKRTSSGLEQFQIPQTSSAPKRSTIKVPFQIKNSYYIRYGKDWESATEKERKDYLKLLRKKEKKRKTEQKYFDKRRKAEAKALSKIKKDEQNKLKALKKEEKMYEKKEKAKKRAASRKRQELKRKMKK